MIIYRGLLIFFFCMGVQNVFAEVYKWKDENGRMQFSDRPPASQKIIIKTDKKSNVSTKTLIREVAPPGSVQSEQIVLSNEQAHSDSIILKLRKLLEQKKFDELNLTLEVYQIAAESNDLAEESLFTAYDAFKINDSSYESLIQAWVKATPDNYQPYMARAKYYFSLGAASRGTKWASETKKEQIAGMKAYFSEAVRDLNKTISINKTFIVPYYTLIGIANMQGEDGCDLGMQSADNNIELEKILQTFKMELQSKKKICAFLLVNLTATPDKWTIAGFNDEQIFKRELITNPGSELSIELKKEPTNESKVIELVASKLGRTLEDDKETMLVKKALKINPLSYKIRAIYLNSLTPRWGGSYKQMQAFIEESLVYVSKNPKLKLLEGYTYAEAGDMQSLIRKYSRSEELYTKALVYGENHEILKDRGKNSYKRENYQDALNDLNRAIELYPDEGDYYYWRSKTYGKLQQFNKSLSDIEQASQLKPGDEYVQKQRKWLVSKLRRQGYELDETGKPAVAVEKYEVALRLEPNDADLHYRKARALINKNQLDLALSDLKTAIEIDANKFKYYLLLDWVLAKRRDWDQIIMYWDQYIALNPDNSRAYVERGGAYYHKGDMNSAVSNAKIAADMGNLEGKEAYEKFRPKRR